MARVDELLGILGLRGVSSKHPSALTGGQRKRLGIGIGLVSRPSVLFLDEPTTGLDSSAAYNIVQYIGKASRALGVVCIMTIHQPAAGVFAKLDDLYLLEQGRLVFSGSMGDAEAFFRGLGFSKPPKENPADFYLDLVAKSPMEMAQQLGASKAYTASTTWSQLFYASEFSDAAAVSPQSAVRVFLECTLLTLPPLPPSRPEPRLPLLGTAVSCRAS